MRFLKQLAFLIWAVTVFLLFVDFSSSTARADVLIVKNLDVAYDSGRSVPPLGWSNVNLPLLAKGNNPGTTDTQGIWLKVTFDRTKIPGDNIALSIEQAGGGIDAYLNESHFFQSYVSPIDQNNAASQPIVFSIPMANLRSSYNSIALRLSVDTSATMLANGIRIGSADEIRRDIQQQYVTRFIGPIMVSAILTFVGLFLFLFWFVSRKEAVLLWLGSFCLLSAILSLAQVVNQRPVAPDISSSMHSIALLLFVPVATGIIGTFFNDPRRKIFVLGSLAAAALAVALRYSPLSGGSFDIVISAIAAAAISAFSLYKMFQAPRSDNILGVFGILAGIIGILHDIAVNAGFWSGVGFLLLPYGLLVGIGALGMAVGQRFAKALKLKDDENEKLGMRIETTKANLMVSENARRMLEISSAVTRERERLMREIHDGIGSSLMAALASAERQGKESSTAVVALKNALTDLRIAVDSLEPVEGNVATLLANLRYRLEPEMRKSGITFEWRVDDVPELDWLDAPNALHILRIFQETLGNTFGHANATKIRVSCNLHMENGRPGIAIEVSDNGIGFDPNVRPRGRGRTNMGQRAKALGGKLTIKSEPGKGSSTKLWLPFLRD